MNEEPSTSSLPGNGFLGSDVLKNNLQYALGDMTPGQKRRFEAIRDWFTSGSWPEHSIEPVSLCRIAPVKISQKMSIFVPDLGVFRYGR